MKIARYSNKDVSMTDEKCNKDNEFRDILKNTIIGIDIANGDDVAVTSYASVCNGIVNLLPVEKKERRNETRKK